VVWWREAEGIWHLQPSADCEATDADAEALLAALAGFRGGIRAPLLIDRRHSYSPSFGALRALWPRAAAFISAMAYCVPTRQARAASMTVIQSFLRTAR